MAFKLLIKESSQKKIPNFVRWFRYVRNTDPFVDELGKMFLCGENEIKVDFEFQIDKIYEVRKEEKKA